MIFTDEELKFLLYVSKQLTFKPGQSEMCKMSEIIIKKITDNFTPEAQESFAEDLPPIPEPK